VNRSAFALIRPLAAAGASVTPESLKRLRRGAAMHHPGDLPDIQAVGRGLSFGARPWRRHTVRRRSIALGLAVACLCAPAPAAADADVTAPVGTVAVVHDDRANELIRLSVPATDDLSGVATVEVSGDGITWASYAYAPEVDWAVFDPTAGGSPGLGNRTVRVRWTDAVGNTSAAITTTLWLGSGGAFEYPVAPVTGQLFTIRPIYAPGVALAPDAQCSWELQWGSRSSLVEYNPDETWGSLYLQGPNHLGFCGDWTFTLPLVQLEQFVIHFSATAMGAGDEDWVDKPRFYPAPGSTDHRIRASNIPLVQILPDTDTLVVGQPITYHAYPIGMSLTSRDQWGVRDPNMVAYKIQSGGSKLTFTPNKPGSWKVFWDSGIAWTTNDRASGAAYDPKARRPDLYRPNTTPPVQRIGSGTPGGTIPVNLTWSGSDQGWGIAKYQLQRSTDGGAWHGVSLPSAKTTSITIPLIRGHRYQFRVRATDKYGNVGSWDYGARFRPRLLSDDAAAYTAAWTTAPDLTALGGSLHTASSAGAVAKFTFTARDVAWIAEKGPGMGVAKVYVDGHLRRSIDLVAGVDMPGQLVFHAHWSAAGTHVIRIVLEGTLGRPVGTVDGFVVLA